MVTVSIIVLTVLVVVFAYRGQRWKKGAQLAWQMLRDCEKSRKECADSLRKKGIECKNLERELKKYQRVAK